MRLRFETRRILFIYYFILASVTISCNYTATLPVDKSSFKFYTKFDSTAKYYYTVNRQTETNIEIEDRELKNINSSTIGFLYRKIKDSAGCSVLQLTYDKLHISSKTKDDEKEIDATGSSFDPVEKILGTILGSSVYVILNKQGQVLKTSGTDEIKEKIVTALNTEDPATIKAVQDQLLKLVGETFFKNNLGRGFTLLPDAALSIGDQWNRQSKQSADISFDANTIYTLKSVTDNIARIEGEGALTSKEDQALVMGYKVSTDLQGSQITKFEIDVNSGQIINEDSKSNIKGTIIILGREVPIEIKLKNTVTVKKM